MQKRSIIRFFGHKLWLVLATLVIAFAALLTVVRLSLPYADRIVPNIEDWLHQQAGIAVDIGNVHASWQQAGVQLALDDVKLLRPAGQLQAMHFDHVQLRLDILRSMFHGRWYFNRVTIDGLNVSINAKQVSHHTDNTSSHFWFNLLLNYFDSFSLKNSSVQLSALPIPVLNIDHLQWQNNGRLHEGTGAISLAGIDAPKLSVAASIDAAPDAIEQAQGRLYAHFQHLDTGRLLQQLALESYPVSADLSGGLWLQFSPHQLQSAIFKLEPSAVYIPGVAGKPKPNVKAGLLHWQRQSAGWQLTAHQLQWVKAEHPVNAQISYQPGMGRPWRAAIDQLPIQPLWPLLRAVKPFDDDWALWVNSMGTHGAIKDIQLSRDQQQRWHGKLHFNDLGWQAWRHLPGFKTINGEATLADSKLTINADLPAQQVQVSDGEFYRDLALDSGHAELQVANDDTGYQLNIRHAKVASGPLHARLTGRLTIPEPATHTSPLLALYGEADLTDAGHAADYFPLPAMGRDVADYLRTALQGGQVNNAQLLWYGRVGAFPFADHQGIFTSNIPLRDGVFSFDRHWPQLEHLNLDAHFINDGLAIRQADGRFGAIHLQHMRGRIAPFRKQSWLKLSATAHGQLEQVAAVMAQTPLKDSLGKSLQTSAAAGKVSSELTLAIPLGSFGDVKASGFAELHDATAVIPGTGLPASHIRGRIRFEDSILHGEQLRGTVLGQKTNVAMETRDLNDSYQVHNEISGHWPASALAQLTGKAGLQYLAGSTDWHAVVDAAFAKDLYTVDIKGQSDLQGLTINLPAPLAKPAEQKQPLTVGVHVGEQQQVQANWQLGETLRGRYRNAGDAPVLALQLGDINQMPALTDHEFRWQAKQVDLTPWLGLLANMPDTGTTTTLPFTKWRGQFEQLQLGHLQLHNVQANIGQQASRWQAQIQAEELNGTITCGDRECDHVGMHLQRAQLHFAAAEQAQTPVDKKPEQALSMAVPKLPALDIYCQHCEINDIALGEVKLKTRPGKDGKSVRLLHGSINGKNGSLKLTDGSWQQQGEAQWSHFEGAIKLKDVGQWIGQLRDIKPPIADSDLHARFDLRWAGAPWQIAAENINGTMDWDLTQGSIPALSDHGARILTLLSLDSLRRKLTLNFNDVYQQGLFYDDFHGFVRAEQGRLNISNTVMNSTAGEMLLKGYFDLRNDKVNLDVMFHPDLTASLPVLAGLAVNPITGLYVLAASTVLKPVVKVVSQVHYKVIGAADDPEVKEVERKSKDVPVRPDPRAHAPKQR